MRILIVVLMLLTALSAHAVIEVRSFEDPKDKQLYEELIGELRCLVCQNQNLAASNADLAKDLRRQTYDMIQDGATKSEILDYMVQRYGDFVLYRPPVKSSTLMLWIGPAVLLAVGLVIVVVVARRRRAAEDLSDEERDQVRRLLED